MRNVSTVQLAGQGNPLASLQATAGREPKAAVKEAARQFEALFMQELLKSMRATAGAGMLDNAGSNLGTEMLDQQYALQMSGKPGGLGDALVRQLEKQMGLRPGATPGLGTLPAGPSRASLPASSSISKAPASAQTFIDRHEAAAVAAQAATGVPADFILGQAAHESGWGRREILRADGSSAHNLFGIKAGPGWKGQVAEITTTEYIGGTAHKVTARFRAYDSYEQAFTDYARLLKDSPRYAGVVAQAQTPQAFAQGLQRAGYATDPNYANKLTRVIGMAARLRNA